MKIINIPTGGLCNRMRSIVTAIAIAKKYNCPLTIQWNNSEGLRANFNELFKPINVLDVELIENRKWIYSINGTKDFLVRKLFLKLMFEQTVFNYSIYRDGEIYDILKNIYHKKLLLVSCYPMCSAYNLQGIFIPQDDIQKRISDITSHFSKQTIGVHIRRTDNIESINSSPTEVFIDKMNKEIEKDETTKFYIASDDKSVKQELLVKYPDRIITIIDDTDRNSLDGMKFAVVDLFCLSKTNKIIGSVASSYSQVASEIGNISIEYAK